MTTIIEPGGSDLGQNLPDDVADYVAAVRSLLADLEPGEVEDLCDDIEQHLLEVRGETDQPFIEVVGSPESFVAELRQSAGLAESANPAPESPLKAFAASLDRAGQRLARHPLAGHVVAFLPELCPAAWVARGYLIAALLAMMTTSWDPFTFLLIPRIVDSALVGLLLTAGLIVGSIRLGRTRRPSVWSRLAAFAAGALAIIGLIALMSEIDGINDNNGDIQATFVGEPDWTMLPANVFAFHPDGTPIEDVLLFDERGEPIDLPEWGYSERLGAEFRAPMRADAFERPIANLYPRSLELSDLHGANVLDRLELERPQVVLPPVILDGATTTTSMPAATTSVDQIPSSTVSEPPNNQTTPATEPSDNGEPADPGSDQGS